MLTKEISINSQLLTVRVVKELGKSEKITFIEDKTFRKVAEALGEEEAAEVIEVLKKSGETVDEEIANKTGIRLNTIRRILYKLYDNSLVSLRRTRDKKTGWFVFHWKLQPDQTDGFILNQKKRVLEKLKMRLQYESTHDFYHCSNPECPRITFEDAIENVFRCSNCGKPLMHTDNKKIKQTLTKKIKTLRKELGE